MWTILYIYLAIGLVVALCRAIFNYKFLTVALLILLFPISPFILAVASWNLERKKAIALIIVWVVALFLFGILYLLTQLTSH
jgi:hypothetical protein